MRQANPRDLWATSRDGTRIHAYEWSPAAAAEALAVVFVPGGTGNAWSGEVVGIAAAAGELGAPRRFIGISRRGMGRSEAPATGYSPASFADDVAGVIAAAGLDRFVVFGHSMGVPISIELALRRPAGLAGLVLGDAPAAYIDFAASGTFDSFLSSRFEFDSWDDAFASVGLGDRARFDAIRHRYLDERPDGRVAIRIDRAALQRTRDESRDAHTTYWDRLGEIEAPTLVLRSSVGWSPLGETDARRYAEAGAPVRVRVLPTGHDLGLNSERAPLFAALAGFLSEIEGS